jgi:hypothetical protein
VRSYTRNVTKKSPATEVKAAPGRVIVVRRDSTTGKRVTTISGRKIASATMIAERLVEILKAQDEIPDSRLFFVTFPEALSRSFRATVVKHVEQRLVAAADEDNPPRENDIRWPRLTMPARSGPSFAILSSDSESNWYCGFWLNSTTLAIGDLNESSPLDGMRSASIAHWHPDSRTSGSWRNHYAALGNGLDVEWRYEDDDGTYIVFYQAPESSPTAVAKRIVKGVTSWYMCGAETQLLTAHFLGFSRGNIAWLKTAEAPGYEIEKFELRADEAVTRELKRLNPPPTQEEASLWLDITKDAVHPSDWERWTTGEHPEKFLMTLRSIADGVNYDDLAL